MMFALKLLGIGRAVTAWIGAAGRWIFARWYRAALIVLITACCVLWFARADALRDRDKALDALAAEKVAHAEFIRSVAEASKEAERRAIRNAERVRAAYAAQAEEASRENTRLAADYAGRAAEFVRRQRAAPDSGRAGATDLSGPAALSAGPVPDAGSAIVHVADLDRCAAGFAQLEALIGFVKGVASVPTVPMESPDARNP